MKTYYDPKCEELARYFLNQEQSATEAEVTELAEIIQRAVEDWWGSR